MSDLENMQTQIRAIERSIVEIQTAIQNLASKQQLRQINAIDQNKYNQLSQEVEDLKTKVDILLTRG